MVKAYVTSHVISKGIVEVEGELVSGGAVFRYAPPHGGYYERYAFARKDNFFLNKEEAIQYAESIRQKRIESLKEQIARLEEIKFF